MNSKKVLLINPPETKQGDFSGPPLGLLYLAGMLLREDIEVDVIDGCLDGWDKIKEKIKTYKPDIVGITCLTPGRDKALKIAKMAKRIDGNILVVLGGVHPTIIPRQILENYPFVDICVLGEGEKTLLEIVQNDDYSEIDGIAYRENDKVIITKPRKYFENLDNIPFPAWHLVNLQRYPAKGRGTVNGVDISKEPRISVVFSRGCVGHCSFCSTWWVWRGWRCRSAKNMADELEMLNKEFGISHFCFADDTLTVDRRATLNLCDEIIRRGLKIAFHITTRVDCVDKEMLKKLREVGCYNIAYGIETASLKLLKEMEKGTDIEISKRAIILTKKAGIGVTVLLIAGSVGENIETINQTIDFLNSVQVQSDEIGSVGGLWILPGTKLYWECKKAGFIGDDFWLSKKPYKLYTAEHRKWVLDIFDYAYRIRRKLSKFKIVNLVKFTPFLIKDWISNRKSALKKFLRKLL